MRLLAPLAFALAACDIPIDIGSRHWDPSGAVEEGPLESVQQITAGRASAFRIEAFAGSMLTLDAPARGAHLWVEGPLETLDDPTPVGAVPIIAETHGEHSHLEIKLRRGVYRVVAGSEVKTAVTLTAACSGQCAREDLSLRTLALKLSRDGRLAPLIEALHAQLAVMVSDEAARRELDDQLDRIVATPELIGLDRFPTVPLHALGGLRRALDRLLGRPVQVIEGDLMSLLGACNLGREAPPSVHPLVPDIGAGHFADGELTRCQAAHSTRLAEILNALAADNGSMVTHFGRHARTPAELITALFEDGHIVEVRNERSYANFLPLTYQDEDVRWPVWLDTGLAIGGSPIVVPLGHSHHAWRIRGAHVNARVIFSMGASGAMFAPQLERRPVWVGLRVRDTGRSDLEGSARIVASLDAASAFSRRTGTLGISNDANALIELATRNTISTFPLLGADEPDRGDGLDALLRALPKDADRVPERMDVLRRLVDMQPHEPGSEHQPDERLRVQLQAITEEVLSY